MRFLVLILIATISFAEDKWAKLPQSKDLSEENYEMVRGEGLVTVRMTVKNMTFAGQVFAKKITNMADSQVIEEYKLLGETGGSLVVRVSSSAKNLNMQQETDVHYYRIVNDATFIIMESKSFICAKRTQADGIFSFAFKY